MLTRKITILILAVVVSLLAYSCSETGVIDADNPYIQYVGRFDKSNPERIVFDWPGVYIRAKFKGTSCSIRLNDGNNFYSVTIDDQPPRVLETDTSTVYSVASNLDDTIHTILIRKRTEANIGKGEFLGFILDEDKGLVKPDSPPNRRIEFIGNSITCGYGVEAASADENFKPETENAALSFAGVISNELNADYSSVAYSGKGVVRNYGDPNKTSADPIPSLYNRTCCYDSTLFWDFASWVPQAVVINLGTNDFSTEPYPDKSVFQEAYTQLINRVQSNYPGVTIFCICGPMIGEPCASYVEEVVSQCRQENTNKNVYFINVGDDLLTMSDRGADWHPNVSGQQKTADVILPVIKEEMSW
ncbi:MAG: SGNH/GDSL hydrolase family protein [Ignavibacteria bacterium]|jgi:lysophospholipase L1-like esterase